MSRRSPLLPFTLLALLLASCGGGTARSGSRAAPTTALPSTTAVTAAPTTAPTTTPPSSAASNLLVTRLTGVGTANQVIAVTTDTYGQTSGTFTAFERVGADWRQAFGPWPAYVGFNGFA